jgi:hypothetical protein
MAAAFKTQADLIREKSRDEETVATEKLRLPGIETLHLRTREEVAEVFANVVLRARKDMMEVKWVLGQYIEITYKL